MWHLNNKVILITGGTGSFGHAFVRHTAGCGIRKLIVFSRDELKQSEMRRKFPQDYIRWFIGDVRDEARLLRAFEDVDIVVHAAAMKQISACEYNPIEAVQTNIIGAQNVITAAIECGVGRVVALSSDKACLDYHARVEFSSGETMSISTLVRDQLTAEVKCYSGGRITSSGISGWYKNKLGGREMVRLSYRTAPYTSKGVRRGLYLTEDHHVLTRHGWKKAGDLELGDLICTSESAPNFRQMALLIGTVLGDSTIIIPGRRRKDGRRSIRPRPYIRLGHAEDQAEWLEVKRGALRGLPLTETSRSKPSWHPGRQPFSRFVVRSSGFAVDLHGAFYRESKIIPKDLVRSYFCPEMVAAWFLDDGCTDGSGGMRIATHSFLEGDVRWLAGFLTDRGFSTEAYCITVDGHKYWELRMGVVASRSLCGYIGRLVPPSMRHKLPHGGAPPFDPDAWDLGAAVAYFDSPIVERVSSYKVKDVYCVDVAGVHNFAAGGVIVHNCDPANLYGATKLVAERLFVHSNAYSGEEGTRFSVVRYGNVIGSRGSVIPLFLEQREAGVLTVTDERMTRFWMTLEQAVELVVDVIPEMSGGEVFIPADLPSMSIVRLAGIIAPDAQLEFTGIRPGEKLHEVLVSPHDVRRTYPFPAKYILLPDENWDWAEKLRKHLIPVPPNFEYSSLSARSLSREEIVQGIAGLDLPGVEEWVAEVGDG